MKQPLNTGPVVEAVETHLPVFEDAFDNETAC